mgnify:CR=1 FL=1
MRSGKGDFNGVRNTETVRVRKGRGDEKSSTLYSKILEENKESWNFVENFALSKII